MNLLILVVLVSEICIGVCVWLSPQFLRWFAAHLLTRADVIEVAKKEKQRRLQFWRDELRLDCDPPVTGNGPSHQFGVPSKAEIA
jgi:hypothetical protein